MNADKREWKARILVEAAAIADDSAASKRLGVSRRSLIRWRNQLETDPVLAQAVAEKKAVAEKAWLADIPAVLQSGIKFLKRAADEADPKDPAVIHAVAGAVKLLAEVQQAQQYLDARINRATAAVGTPAGPTPTGAATTTLRAA